MEQIINILINNFDYPYMFSINILTYLIIKLLDNLNGDELPSFLTKRIVLIINVIIITLVYVLIGYDNKIILVNSAIAAPIFWSWILRPICIKFGIGYKDIDNYLN